MGASNADGVGKNVILDQYLAFRSITEVRSTLDVDHAVVHSSYHGRPFTAQTATHQ